MEKGLKAIDQIEEYLNEAGIALERNDDYLIIPSVATYPLLIHPLHNHFVHLSTYFLSLEQIHSYPDIPSLYFALLCENNFTKWGRYVFEKEIGLGFVVRFRIADLSKEMLLEIIDFVRYSLEERVPEILAQPSTPGAQIQQYLKEADIPFEIKEGNISLTNRNITISRGNKWLFLSTYPTLTDPLFSTESLAPLFKTVLQANDSNSLGQFCLLENNSLAYALDFRLQDLNKDLLLEAIDEVSFCVEKRWPQFLMEYEAVLEQSTPINQVEQYLKEGNVSYDREGEILYLKDVTTCSTAIHISVNWIYVTTGELFEKPLVASERLASFFASLLVENDQTRYGKFYLLEDNFLAFAVDLRIQDLKKDLLMEAIAEIYVWAEKQWPKIRSEYEAILTTEETERE